MSEPGLSDTYTRASPWPLLVALGFVLSELGVVFGVRSVTVGGLLLFIGSVSGILAESQHVSRPLLTVGCLSVLAGLGGVMLLVYDAMHRGTSMLLAGGIGLFLAVSGTVYLQGEVEADGV